MRSAPAPGQPGVLSGFGPGKVILLGEHGVVYGRPALAAPLSWGVTATGVAAKRCALKVPSDVPGVHRRLLLRAFDRAAIATGRPKVSVQVAADLPTSMGLGSSAALAVACAKVLLQASGKPTSATRVAKVALEMEREFHGTPSGLDHTTSAQATLIHFQKSRGAGPGQVREVECRRPLKVLVALVGERSPTRQTVLALRERKERWPRRYDRLFDEIGQLVEEGARALTAGDLETLGDLLNVNQGLLSALQLSSPDIEQMVHRLRRAGALGAKLTGAGGDGGAVIGLFLEPEPVMARLSREGIRCFSSQLAGPRAL